MRLTMVPVAMELEVDRARHLRYMREMTLWRIQRPVRMVGKK